MAKTIKHTDLNHNYPFPLGVWTPAISKRIKVTGITGAIHNQDPANFLRIDLSVNIDGTLRPIFSCIVLPESVANICVVLPNDFYTSVSDGTTALLVLSKHTTSASTLWHGFVSLIGEEI